METKIIKAGEARYLSELPEFQDGLPHGIVNKTKTDVGGTYVAANCRYNYIIVCPFRDLVDSIAADKNNKYEIFKCYGGTREQQFRKYAKEHKVYKIAVTYDSLDKLLKWMGNNTDIDEEYEVDFFKILPHYKVVWPLGLPITVRKIKATCLPHGLAKLISIFKEEGIYLPDISGERKKVEQLFIFLNSVTTIKQVIDTLELEEDEVKVCCAQRQRNRLILGKFKRESAISPNKRINFFTKKSFQGCNLFSNNGLIIVASDVHRTQTLVDITTTMEQISGRLRENDEYHNIFRNTMVHIFSTNNSVLSQAEFDAEMNRKEDAAVRLLSLQKKADEKELNALIKRVNIENDILSIEEGRLVRNELKKKAFIRKQKIREAYKDGINLRAAYNKSEKFIQAKQEYWYEFDSLLARAVTISYEKLLKDYLEHPSEQYEIEYPEFKDIRRYLKETEMNSCRWNKEKMLKVVEDKKKLQQAFRAIYQRGAFISDNQMKILLAEQFNRLGINLSPKATQILNCDIYHVDRCS